MFFIGEQGEPLEKISIRFETPSLEPEKEEILLEQLSEKILLQNKGQQENDDGGEKRNEQIKMTFWKQEDGSVKNSSLKREVAGSVVTVYGTVEAIEPMTYILGNGLFSDEKKGCLINDEMAEQLFGSYTIYGKKIQWQDQTYIIRGVVKQQFLYGQKETPKLYILGGEKESYNNCEIAVQGTSLDTTSVKEVLEQQYGSSFAIWNGYMALIWIKMVIIGILWGGLLLTISIIYKEKRKECYERRKWAGQQLEADKSRLIQKGQKRKNNALFLWNLIYFLQQKVVWGTVTSFLVLPQDWIPTKWSDFPWYSERIQQWREQSILWQELCQGEEYQRIRQYYYKVEIYVCIMIVGFIYSVYCMHHRKRGQSE